MWETIHIIEQMGEWKPKYVIWENVKNVRSKHMRANHDRYIKEMSRLGYTSRIMQFLMLENPDYHKREKEFLQCQFWAQIDLSLMI